MSNKQEFYDFDKIFIDVKYKNNKYVERILSKIPVKKNIEYTDDPVKLIKKIPSVLNPAERAKSLLLTGLRGEILQKCPGSFGHICCNYYVINLYIGCPINCSYCILQSYLNQPFIIINVNIDEILNSLGKILENNKNGLRIGTGELGDSLVYDPITDFSIDFINFFKNYPHSTFEFKTKTDFIENILLQDSPGNIVIGFSVNPEVMIESEEEFAAGIDKRIKAAKKAVNKGYYIALHFDPIYNIKDFDNQYMGLIDKIFAEIRPEKIAWISLGTFRYTGDLRNMVEYNFPDSKILLEEFVENADKKFRYFKPIRIKLYKKILKKLNSIDKNLAVYLCMESPYVWKNVIGTLPGKDIRINKIFKKVI